MTTVPQARHFATSFLCLFLKNTFHTSDLAFFSTYQESDESNDGIIDEVEVEVEYKVDDDEEDEGYVEEEDE